MRGPASDAARVVQGPDSICHRYTPIKKFHRVHEEARCHKDFVVHGEEITLIVSAIEFGVEKKRPVW